MVDEWEDEIAALLQELSGAQSELLDVLGEKRRMLLEQRLEELESLQPRERELAERLQNCHRMRHELLERAGEQGMPCDTIRDLAAAVEPEPSGRLETKLDEATVQTRLLQHKSLSNWVYVQKSLLHLSQLLEIIATGGRPQPTYGSAVPSPRGGTMVDQAV